MIRVKLKKILLDANISLTELAAELGKRLNKKYTLTNLSNKLSNGNIKAKELELIGDILGYDLDFIKRK